MGVQDFCEKYKVIAEVDRDGDLFRNVGVSRSSTSLLETGAQSIEITTSDLKGWGFEVHAVVDFGVGRKMSIFARQQ